MKKPIPFGKYYLLERINVGGMAEVFRAKAFGVEGFERLVAVKRILPNIAEDKEFIRMFIDEAKIAVQLNHANIAQIFDLGMVEQHYYIALEHIHGRDLRAIYDRCRHKGEPMPIAQACFVTMKVCEGLDYAHNKRDQGGRELHLVHRDVSPQNMLVSFEGEVKIIDFGIAKAAGKGSKTQAGILKGKFGYMSPEQVRGLPIDRRSDVFSCGIVLYELLTGERLFYGESDFDTLEKVRNVEILPPTTYNRKIPDELERIVLKALAKDVEDRYQNAIDLHDELQAFVYTAGEFYSRKDLAGWMKSVFVKEIEEETAKLEAYRQIAAPDVRSEGDKRPTMPPPRRQTAIIGTAPPPLPGAPGGKKTMQGPAVKVEKTEELVWDEDELETSIYEEEERKRLAVAGSAVAVAASGAPVEPDLAALVTTARGWAAADHPLAAPGRLADGTDETSHAHAELAPTMDGRAAEPAHSREPSAIVRLEGLSRTGSAPALPMPHDAGFGNTFMGQPRRGISLGATIAIAATAITAVVVIVLFVVLGNRADDAPTADDGALAAAKPEVAPTAPVEAAPTPAVAPSEPAVALDPALQALTGFDLIVDPPGVLVKLDGRPIGKAPLQIRNLSPGEHAVEIEAPAGFFNKAQPVAVEAGKAGRVFIPLDAMDISASLTSEPADARYTLLADGQKVATGKTPDQVKLDPRRRYEVSFNRPGFLPETRSISIDPSGRVEILAVLTRSGSGERVAVTPPIDKPAVDKPVVDKPVVDKPVVDKPVVDEPAVAAGTGTLNLGSKPPCRIFIDGRDSGQKTPLIGFELDAGKHKITLVNNEFGIKETFSVTIEADKPTKVIKDLSDRMPGQ